MRWCNGSNRINSIISLTGGSSKVCTSWDATQDCKNIYTIPEECIVAIRSNKIDRDRSQAERQSFFMTYRYLILFS